MRLRFHFIALVVIGLTLTQNLLAHNTSVSVDTLTNLIDGNIAPFNQLHPGDTVLFEPGSHEYIIIRNFTGASGNPIIFTNKKGVVSISNDNNFGISIRNCRFIRLTGTGDAKSFYGFKITHVLNGAGIGVGSLSSDFEIDHVSVENTKIGGIYAKTDPDCSLTATRDQFTQFNTIIHDNYIANVGNEGLYIGSTKYFGQLITCTGNDTLVLPSLLQGVRIYNNIIKYSGWDGIQVSSASSDCQVYDNLIMFDSQAESYAQMSGIMLGGGSKCDCYNNYIVSGKGCGIESHGLGGYRIFNNIIVDAGRSFKPLDTTQMKFGIYVTDISVQADSSFYIMHNDIINPKTDGIRFSSVLSKGNLIASNVIINPGAYKYYEHIHTSFSGEDSYVMLPNSTSDVIISNNFFSRYADSTGFEGDKYKLTENSLLIDAAYTDTKGISIDADHNPRVSGTAPDIGAYEFSMDYLDIFIPAKEPVTKVLLFPNPVMTILTIKYICQNQSEAVLSIFNLKGERVICKFQPAQQNLDQQISVDVDYLPAGVYVYKLSSGNQTSSGKFIKVN